MSDTSSPASSRSQTRPTTPGSTHSSESKDVESAPYVHPGLAVGVDPAKGRQVTPTTLLKDGEVLMIDKPYALVPAMLTDQPPFQICSRHDCNRRLLPGPENSVRCLQGCIAEAVWCDEECRAWDNKRHTIECAWLKRFADQIRQTHGDCEFGLLWMIARILIARNMEQQQHIRDPSTETSPTLTQANNISSSHFGRRGWDAVWNLEGHIGAFSTERIYHWRQFVRNYLATDSLGLDVDTEEIVNLICKVETNSFGLYPGVTGEYPVTSFVSRGEYYGGGIYPTAAMFNHSCCPNVSLWLSSIAALPP